MAAFFLAPMNQGIQKRNFKVHLLEGILYIASGALLSGQTVIPAIVLTLGGTPAVIGAIPVILYVTFQVPQVFSALHARTLHERKPWVIRGGMAQRFHILAMAVVLAVSADVRSPWLLVAFLTILALNQMFAGLVSPVWIDFLARTTATTDRGRLLGWRSAGGALFAFLNSLLLTALLSALGFSWAMALAFGVAFAFQFSSVLVQRRVVELPDESVRTDRTPHSFADIRRVVRTDVHLRRFLMSWGFVTAASTVGTFFIPLAIERFTVDASAVGIYTMVLVAAQILSGVSLGWVSDRFSSRGPLVVSAVGMAVAIIIASLATSPFMMAFAFLAMGVPLGSEMMARYNFVVDSAPAEERSLYVGIMNLWLAPWQAISIPAGMAIATLGYRPVFLGALGFSFIGLLLLRSVKDRRRP